MELHRIQRALRDQGMDGWLLCDFHNRDHLAYRVLGLPTHGMTTRRWYYYIPARGRPKKLVHAVERRKLDSLPGSGEVFRSWKELHDGLKRMLGKRRTIAMQYSPRNSIPYVSLVDAGTVDLVRDLGHTVVSSADLVQMFESVIGPKGYALHKAAGKIVDRIRGEAFEKIRRALASRKRLTEYELQQYILRRFAAEGLITKDPPIVGTNEHPADPHFECTPSNARPFKRGDTILVDLWARKNTPGGIYYDITWVGYAGDRPPGRYRSIFETVRKARDAATAFVEERMSRGVPCHGWEVDDVCRAVVRKAGYGRFFVHRTGHSIGEEVHGNGVNMDNLETKDDRRIIPGCCFSVEPGIYLEGEMAVRSEVNMFIRHDGTAEVTGEVQHELVLV
ncbi:MAG: M24 family metallopeptidase [Bacteroidota bacterium]